MKKTLFVLILCLLPSIVFAVDYTTQYAFEYPPGTTTYPTSPGNPGWFASGTSDGVTWTENNLNYNDITGVLTITPAVYVNTNHSVQKYTPYYQGDGQLLSISVYDYQSSTWNAIEPILYPRATLGFIQKLQNILTKPNVIYHNPAGTPLQTLYPQGIPALIPPPPPPPPPPPLPGPMDALFAASDFFEFSGNVSILLIIFIGVYLLFLGYRYVKNSIGRIVV